MDFKVKFKLSSFKPVVIAEMSKLQWPIKITKIIKKC